MVADIWQWTPLMFLILLAGLLGVPEDQLSCGSEFDDYGSAYALP